MKVIELLKKINRMDDHYIKIVDHSTNGIAGVEYKIPFCCDSRIADKLLNTPVNTFDILSEPDISGITIHVSIK